MKIRAIEITHIKGIQNRVFNLDLIPNKPNLLVAPNGFGKSSFGMGFASLKRNRLELDDKSYFENEASNLPEIKITIENEGTTTTISADTTQNSISNEFDVFVINNQLVAKATVLRFGGNAVAKSSLEIEQTTLVATVPQKITFDYSSGTSKRDFGTNGGKVLKNVSELFENSSLMNEIVNTIQFQKFSQTRNAQKIQEIKSEINAQTGTGNSILSWIEDNLIEGFRAVDELNKLASIIRSYNFDIITDETSSFLAAFQVLSVQRAKGNDFRKACKYLNYLSEKAEYSQMIASFNSTRFNIKPKEERGKGLIVKWPKAHEISNGQRDTLSFVALMLKARRSLTKQNCILIIDEIFDYLDDANLISFQYFITNFIEDMKRQGKNFFPLLMTHLDPMFFNHFCFNRHKIKVHYLKDAAGSANLNLLKLIKEREDASIQSSVDQFYFHFDPGSVNLQTEFTSLGLNLNWADSNNFHAHIQNEVAKYLNDQTNYDPLAICFGVRIKIEELIYNQIADATHKQDFINTHGTKKKLEYCQQIGLDVPETYYLLGIIYNDRLHWRPNLDIVKPVAIKLENITIKKLIRDIF